MFGGIGAIHWGCAALNICTVADAARIRKFICVLKSRPSRLGHEVPTDPLRHQRNKLVRKDDICVVGHGALLALIHALSNKIIVQTVCTRSEYSSVMFTSQLGQLCSRSVDVHHRSSTRDGTGQHVLHCAVCIVDQCLTGDQMCALAFLFIATRFSSCKFRRDASSSGRVSHRKRSR